MKLKLEYLIIAILYLLIVIGTIQFFPNSIDELVSTFLGFLGAFLIALFGFIVQKEKSEEEQYKRLIAILYELKKKHKTL